MRDGNGQNGRGEQGKSGAAKQAPQQEAKTKQAEQAAQRSPHVQPQQVVTEQRHTGNAWKIAHGRDIGPPFTEDAPLAAAQVLTGLQTVGSHVPVQVGRQCVEVRQA